MYILYFIVFFILLSTGKIYYIVNLNVRSSSHSIHTNTSFGESVKSIFLCIFSMDCNSELSLGYYFLTNL
jgi:hypothetical protein